MRFCQTKDLSIKFSDTLLLLVNKRKAYFKLCRLLRTDRAVYSSLTLFDRMLTAVVYIYRYSLAEASASSADELYL